MQQRKRHASPKARLCQFHRAEQRQLEQHNSTGTNRLMSCGDPLERCAPHPCVAYRRRPPQTPELYDLTCAGGRIRILLAPWPSNPIVARAHALFQKQKAKTRWLSTDRVLRRGTKARSRYASHTPPVLPEYFLRAECEADCSSQFLTSVLVRLTTEVGTTTVPEFGPDHEHQQHEHVQRTAPAPRLTMPSSTWRSGLLPRRHTIFDAHISQQETIQAFVQS